MSISIDKILHRYTHAIPPVKTESKATAKSVSGKNFDEVMIHSNKRQIEEKKFAESLSKEALSQISQPVPESKLESLKNAVSEGLYHVDADQVASRILLQKGE